MKFIEKLLAASRANNSLLCVGLDPEPHRFPPQFLGERAENAVIHFCQAIIETTAPYVCAFKPNMAFFEALGPHGMYVYQEAMEAVPADIPVILDAKRGDIDNSARNYATAVFDVLKCDAVTVNPYLGQDSVSPFLAYHDKGVFLLCRTSNPGARDFQDLLVRDEDGEMRPLYETIARRVPAWNAAENCGLVVGATYPEELRMVRALCPEMPILVPGVGVQGGNLAAAVSAGVDAHGERAVISVSRSIIYAGDDATFAQAAAAEAQTVRDMINEARFERSSKLPDGA